MIAAVGLGAVLALFLGSVVCDPLYDGISEAAEAELLGHPVEAKAVPLRETIAGIARELRASLLSLAVYLAGSFVLFVVGLTGVGSVIAGPGSLAWTWLFVTVEVIARPQARHAVEARARVATSREHLAVSLGFGAVASLLAWIPMSTPILVAGGTRLYLALAAHDRVPSTLTEADKRRLREGAA